MHKIHIPIVVIAEFKAIALFLSSSFCNLNNIINYFPAVSVYCFYSPKNKKTIKCLVLKCKIALSR